MTKIYGLYEIDGDLRYVGKTCKTLDHRLQFHLYAAKDKAYRVCRWIRRCLKDNFGPFIKLIEEVEGDGSFEERYWIKYFRDAGFDLVNGTEGGDGGAPMLGKHHSAEAKRKMSEANKGKHRSAETRQKMSIAKKGTHLSDEAKEHLRVLNTGEKHPMFGKPKSSETRRKISETLKGKYGGANSPMFGQRPSSEARQKMSEARKAYHTRRKMSEARSAFCARRNFTFYPRPVAVLRAVQEEFDYGS